MGLMDALGAEVRVEITVQELMSILKAREKAEISFDNAMAMLREGVSPETVRAVFGYKPDIQPVELNCKTIKEVNKKCLTDR